MMEPKALRFANRLKPAWVEPTENVAAVILMVGVLYWVGTTWG